jgi:hypothetical protein
MTRFCKTVNEGGKIRTLVEFQIETNEIPSDDPLAYAYGFMQGYVGDPLVGPGEKRSELAKAYIQGHEVGKQVVGDATPMPPWVKEVKRD